MVRLIQRWLMIITLLAINCTVLIHYGVQPVELLKFFLFIIFLTILPGLLFINWLRLYPQDGYKFVLAAIIGIILDIILYILMSILNWPELAYWTAGLSLALLLIVKPRLGLDLRLILSLPTRLDRTCFFTLSLLSMLITGLLIIFQYIPNPMPGGTESLIYYVDQPWHLGNIAEITNHWYPQDPRLVGFPFNYHIFVYIFIAFLAKVSGLSLPVLYFRLVPFFMLHLLLAGVYFVGSRWFHRRAAGVAHGLVFFGLGTILLSYPSNLFLVNLFTSPTFLLACILVLPLLVEMKAYLEDGRTGRVALILLLVSGISGAKGNFWPLLYAGLLTYGIYSLATSKPRGRIWLLLATTLVPFLLVYTSIFKGAGSEGFKIVPFEVVRFTRLYEVGAIWWVPGNPPWRQLIPVAVFVVSWLGIRLAVMIKLVQELVRSYARLSFEQVFMAGTITASFLTGFLLSYRGRSEYFFLYIGLICLNLLASGYLVDIYKNHWLRWPQLLMGVIILLSVVDTGLTAYRLPQIIPELAVTEYKPLTPRLYEALSFIRDHTEPDVVIASNRAFIYAPNDPRFFYYSAFGERRMLVEGWGYMSPTRQAQAQLRYKDMQTLFTTWDEELAGTLLKKYAVDYVIVENRLNQHLWFNTGRYLQLRFENGDTEIYETI